jgi:hypothetical protein
MLSDKPRADGLQRHADLHPAVPEELVWRGCRFFVTSEHNSSTRSRYGALQATFGEEVRRSRGQRQDGEAVTRFARTVRCESSPRN